MFWEKPGRQNTLDTVDLAVRTANERGIEHVVIASNTGESVFRLLEVEGSAEPQIVCITHHVGFRAPGEDEMPPEVREELTAAGVRVYTGTHLLAGVDRGLRNEYGGLYPPEIMANTLRMLGQGVKVCVEIGIMALDAGLIPYEREIIACGGTGRGTDTAVVLRPAHSNRVFELRIVEILCRPRI